MRDVYYEVKRVRDDARDRDNDTEDEEQTYRKPKGKRR